ncbi:hypothetical protein NJH83_31630, partial [Pseudomonas chlororaphis]|uniref:hypothetical protein n=2 Tax=Pseudomonas TaxID=286 RepID=UPI00209B084F
PANERSEAQVVEVVEKIFENFLKNRLTVNEAAVECAPRLRRKILTNRSLTTESSNSCGCLWSQTDSQKDYQHHKLLREKSKM